MSKEEEIQQLFDARPLSGDPSSDRCCTVAETSARVGRWSPISSTSCAIFVILCLCTALLSIEFASQWPGFRSCSQSNGEIPGPFLLLTRFPTVSPLAGSSTANGLARIKIIQHSNPPATQSPSESPVTWRPTAVVSTNARTVAGAEQIKTFRDGNALMLLFHITHHAGTTFCHMFRGFLRAPSFACMGVKNDNATEDFPTLYPWAHNVTSENIGIVKERNHYDMISWEMKDPAPKRIHQLPETDWENPRLLSIAPMRHPIDRLLSGSEVQIPNGTLHEWWNYARDDRFTDNFAMRILSGYECCKGARTSPVFLERAKAMVRRFTYVLDVACMDAGMKAVADDLNMQNFALSYVKQNNHKHVHQSAKERIPYPEVYEYLLEKNRLDIELYEWSKTLALVNCSLES